MLADGWPAVVRPAWTAAGEWAGVLDRAAALDPRRWAEWCDGMAADRFAGLWAEWRTGADGVIAGLAGSAGALRAARDDVSLADASSSETHDRLAGRLG